MTLKLTYAEQLKHPKWQKKRLEMLDAAEWECSNCGDKDTMLHVHHRRYVKGRMAWEYSQIELSVLCENCHKGEHAADELMKEILALTDATRNAGLLAGFHNRADWIEKDVLALGRDQDALTYAAGFVAYLVSELGDIDKMLMVARYAADLHSEYAEGRMVFMHSRGNTFGEGL
jgi:hypothetical protein